jgi:hypothetical protein
MLTKGLLFESTGILNNLLPTASKYQQSPSIIVYYNVVSCILATFVKNNVFLPTTHISALGFLFNKDCN